MNIQAFRTIAITLLVAFLFSATGKVHAQADDNHFIYIQADNRKPFYVILNDKLYSSSSIGYLIIPKLKSGTYNITLGFPQNTAPEQKFVTVVKSNDIGYSLKSIDKNTYTLTDLQTQEVLTSNGKAQPATTPRQEPVIAKAEPLAAEVKTRTEEINSFEEEMAAPAPEQKVAVTETPAKPRGFGELMSSVSNDPDLAKPEEKPQPAAPKKDPFEEVTIVRSTDVQELPAAPETTPVENTAPPAEPTRQRAVVSAAAQPVLPDTYGVVRTKDNTTSEGREMSFVLLSNTMTDSVTIFVPNEEEVVSTDNQSSASATQRKKSIAYFDYDDLAQTPPPVESNTTRRRNRNNNDEKFLNNNSNTPANSSGEIDNPFYSANTNNTPNVEKSRTDEVVERNTPVVSTSSSATTACKGGSISDRDFNKMRNKMIGRDNDDEMVSTAMDMLGNQCITITKVKTLGGLFITDNGRLKFFNAVEKNVSDKQNFASLEEQIYDRGKKEQFRNMLNR